MAPALSPGKEKKHLGSNLGTAQKMDGICSILLGLRDFFTGKPMVFTSEHRGVRRMLSLHPVLGCSGNMQHTYSGESVCTEFG